MFPSRTMFFLFFIEYIWDIILCKSRAYTHYCNTSCTVTMALTALFATSRHEGTGLWSGPVTPCLGSPGLVYYSLEACPSRRRLPTLLVPEGCSSVTRKCSSANECVYLPVFFTAWKPFILPFLGDLTGCLEAQASSCFPVTETTSAAGCTVPQGPQGQRQYVTVKATWDGFCKHMIPFLVCPVCGDVTSLRKNMDELSSGT